LPAVSEPTEVAVVPQSVPSVGVPANDAADHTNRTAPAIKEVSR
jgi:hypothetical protein